MAESRSALEVFPFDDVVDALPQTTVDLKNARASGDPAAVDRACHDLLRKCQELFRAEVCAIFLIDDGRVTLQAQVGYDHPGGNPIPFDELRRHFTYEVLPYPPGHTFPGITSMVASTGLEYGADSWEEIRQHPSHVGKPDQLRIWDDKRPFRCMFAVPLKLGDRTIGVLKVENKRDPENRRATFDDVDKQLLRTLARWFGSLLQSTGFVDADTRTKFEALAQKLDHSNMRAVIEGLPTQIQTALAQPMPAIRPGPFARVVIIGMGGSALPADVVLAVFGSQLRVPLTIVRNYALPAVDERTLIIASSFSGSTEETLSAIECLPSSFRNVVVVTAGGRLRALADQRGYPVIRIPIELETPRFQPRSAVGYLLTYFARVLAAAGVMSDQTDALASASLFLRGLDVRKDAEDVATWLKDKIPIIYTDEQHLMSVARLTKIKFNENSKRAAFFNSLPEANHNEMIGFVLPLARFGVLYLHDAASIPRIRQRFQVMSQIFRRDGLDHVDFREWEIPGDTTLQKTLSALLFAEWCSYTLALLDGFDPTPVDLVERFKTELVSTSDTGHGIDA